MNPNTYSITEYVKLNRIRLYEVQDSGKSAEVQNLCVDAETTLHFPQIWPQVIDDLPRTTKEQLHNITVTAV